MKIVVEVEDFYLDEDSNLEEGLKSYVTKQVLAEIASSIKSRVDTQILVEVKSQVENSMYKQINAYGFSHLNFSLDWITRFVCEFHLVVSLDSSNFIKVLLCTK